MKVFAAILFAVAWAAGLANETRILPATSIGVAIRPSGDTPACHLAATVDSDGKYLTNLLIKIGEATYDIPPPALRGIEYPDLNSLCLEIGADERGKSYTIRLRPARYTEFSTWFTVSIVSGKFTKVMKVWDVNQKSFIERRFETLHEEKKEPNQ
jgi:hypothetical protein